MKQAKPFVIGVFCGKGKPDDINNNLSNFVDEAKKIEKDGVYLKE